MVMLQYQLDLQDLYEISLPFKIVQYPYHRDDHKKFGLIILGSHLIVTGFLKCPNLTSHIAICIDN